MAGLKDKLLSPSCAKWKFCFPNFTILSSLQNELNSVWLGWRTNCFVRAVDFVPLLARDLKLLDRELQWWKKEKNMDVKRWTGAKIDNVDVLKMKRCGQEQDFPLSSASITSPPKTELPPFPLKIWNGWPYALIGAHKTLERKSRQQCFTPAKQTPNAKNGTELFLFCTLSWFLFGPKKCILAQKQHCCPKNGVVGQNGAVSPKQCFWPKTTI